MNAPRRRSALAGPLAGLRDRWVGRTPAVDPEPWAEPPLRTPAHPEVRALLLASDRVASGLAEVWTRVDIPEASLSGGAPVGGQAPTGAGDVDLVLVEVVEGLPVPETELASVPVDAPLVVWATSGGPSPAVGDLVAAASAVYVADPDQLPAWQAVIASATLLAPATSARRRPVRERAGVAVVATGPVAPELAGPVATVLARAVRSLEDQLVVRRHPVRPDAPGALPKLLSQAAREATYPELTHTLGRAAVAVDGPRRHRHDTWTVLDVAATGTPVVSLAGLPSPFPESVEVPSAASEQALRGELIARLHQRELSDREALRLRRAVLADHTWAHRAAVLASAIAPRPLRRPDRPVSAVVPTNRPHEIDNVLANLGRQAHVDTELVLVLHGLELDHKELGKRAAEAGVPHLVVVEAPRTATLGACMNLGIDAASGAYVAKMDDDNHYGRHYLTDLLDAFETSGAGIVGKWAHYVWLQSTGAVVLRHPEAEHSYARRIQGGSMLFDGDLVRELRFSDLPRAVDSDILDRALGDGVKVWSSDRFNYVSIRGVDRTAHTWTVDDATFLTAAGRLEFYGDPRPHVEV